MGLRPRVEGGRQKGPTPPARRYPGPGREIRTRYTKGTRNTRGTRYTTCTREALEPPARPEPARRSADAAGTGPAPTGDSTRPPGRPGGPGRRQDGHALPWSLCPVLSAGVLPPPSSRSREADGGAGGLQGIGGAWAGPRCHVPELTPSGRPCSVLELGDCRADQSREDPGAGPGVPAWGKNCARGWACGIPHESSNFLDRGEGCKDSSAGGPAHSCAQSWPLLPACSEKKRNEISKKITAFQAE